MFELPERGHPEKVIGIIIQEKGSKVTFAVHVVVDENYTVQLISAIVIPSKPVLEVRMKTE